MEKIKRIFFYQFNMDLVKENIMNYLPRVSNEAAIEEIAVEYMKMVIDCRLVGIDHKIIKGDQDGILVEMPDIIPLGELEKYIKKFDVNLPFYSSLDTELGENKIRIEVKHQIDYNQE